MDNEESLARHIAAHPGDRLGKLVFADFLDEIGKSIRAAWLRSEGREPPKENSLNGNGDGNGNGNGYGYGYGYGYGNGNGDGNGNGNGSGDGNGNGSGDGNGNGSGDGNGNGSGDGYGSGDGNGYGNGHSASHQEVIDVPNTGQFIIVRSRDQGCVCGEYQYHCGREVGLLNARQIYSWSGERLTLIDFAVIPGECRLSRPAPGELVMLEACAMIPTTPEVEKFLRECAAE